jgi:hypothetical protein
MTRIPSIINHFLEFEVLLMVSMKRIVFWVVVSCGGSLTFQRNMSPLYLGLKSKPSEKPIEACSKLRSACCVLATQNGNKLEIY